MSGDTLLRRISKYWMTKKRKKEEMDPLLQRIMKGNGVVQFGSGIRKRGVCDSLFQRVLSGNVTNNRRAMPTIRDVERVQRMEAMQLLRSIESDERVIERSNPSAIIEDQIDEDQIQAARFGYELSRTIEELGEVAGARSQEALELTENALEDLCVVDSMIDEERDVYKCEE